jgi:hypothetical protein
MRLPTIIIFHAKRSEKCYAFGGRCTVRFGALDDFEPFLGLPYTWYLADRSPNPVLNRAMTIISALPKTLASEIQQFKDIDKKCHGVTIWPYGIWMN